VKNQVYFQHRNKLIYFSFIVFLSPIYMPLHTNFLFHVIDKLKMSFYQHSFHIKEMGKSHKGLNSINVRGGH
jgi:hypothetical protein